MHRHPLNQPWAISEDGLQLVLAVHSRGQLFADRLARARADVGGRDLENASAMIVVDGVAQIPIVGPLFRHASMLTDVSGATSYGDIAKDLRAALEDPEVTAIVLCIDSPGGEAAGVGELAERIRAAAARKPVTAYAEGSCCSAAYWLACGATEIVAAPSAWLGSIGVRIAVVDDAAAQEKIGVRRVEIVSSQSPGKRGEPIDDDVLARLQSRADELAEIFVQDVARFRGTDAERVLAEFGQGDVLIGSKAVAAGMADRLGSLDALMAQLSAPPAGAPQTAPAGAQTRTTTMNRADALRALGLTEAANKTDVRAKLKELRMLAMDDDEDAEDKDHKEPDGDEAKDEDEDDKDKKKEDAKMAALVSSAVTAAVQPLQERLDKLEKKPAQAARQDRLTQGGAPRGTAPGAGGEAQAVKDYVKKLWS